MFDPLSSDQFLRRTNESEAIDRNGNRFYIERKPQVQFPPLVLFLFLIPLLLLLLDSISQREPSFPNQVEPEQLIVKPNPVNFQLPPTHN